MMIADLTDSELTGLIDQIRHESTDAAEARESLNRICERLRPRLLELCRGRLHAQLQTKEAESDLVQEALLGVSQSFQAFRGETAADLYAWAAGILDNKSLEMQRRYLGTGKRDVGLERRLAGVDSGQPGAVLQNTSGTPLEKLVRAEDAVRVRELIAVLPVHYRDVVQLRHVEDLAFPEIAARMGRTEPSVKNIYVRALEILERGMRS